MTVVMDEKFTKCNKPYKWGFRHRSFHADCSEDKYLRGFSIDEVFPKKKATILNFFIDVTQEKCTLAVGECLRPEWKHIRIPNYRTNIFFYAASGRLWFIEPRNAQHAVIPVIDVE